MDAETLRRKAKAVSEAYSLLDERRTEHLRSGRLWDDDDA